MHDELVLEVDPSMVAEAGKLLQISMETAASLLGIIFALNCLLIFISKLKTDCWLFLVPVPLRTKIKVGKTWGSLQPFHPEP